MSHPRRVRLHAILVFCQMLPAILVIPAVRPWLAARGASDGTMHAFMSLNMLGAALAAPWLGRLVDRRADRRGLLRALAAADAGLLLACTLPLPTGLLLGLRTLEGAAHVGALTVLMADLAELGRRRGDPRLVGVGGAAIMAAVASGSVLGAALLGLGARAPFFLAVVVASAVAVYGPRVLASDVAPRAAARVTTPWRGLRVPLAAAFVTRFTVGCVVVTFALYAHRELGLSDAEVGGLFASLTVPFALGTYPAAHLARVASPGWLLGGGAAVYGAALIALPWAPVASLAPLMIVAGLASAAVFAAILALTAGAAGDARRGAAMALVTGAGCAGMLLGPAVAGITSAIVRSQLGALAGYRAVFALAGASVLLWLACALPWLRAPARAAELHHRAEQA